MSLLHGGGSPYVFLLHGEGSSYVSLLHGGDPIVLGEGWGDVPSATPKVQMGKLRHRQWVGGGGRGEGCRELSAP